MQVTGVNSALSVIAVLIAGYLSDKLKFRYLFAVSFLMRAGGFFGFTQIDSPEDGVAKFLLYVGFFGSQASNILVRTREGPLAYLAMRRFR